MRTKIVIAATIGTLAITGLALAGPALAAVAGDSKTSTSTAPPSPVERFKTALKGLVTDKTLTQAQADKVASTLAAAGPGAGGPGGPGGGPGHDGMGGMRDLATAAATLKMSEADLQTALKGGKTLAQVAKEKSVSVDTLVAALVKAAKEHIAQDVKDGRLTQARADEMLATLTQRITERVNNTRPTKPAEAAN